MADPAFTIYGSGDRYTAVTNPVRLRILEALEDDELELGDLVGITDRSKSTLSGSHLPDLVERGLVEVVAHPTDGRKQRYRLAAARIGSSELPIEDLRQAVSAYVEGGQGRVQEGASWALAAIVAAPEGTDPAVITAQASQVGHRLAQELGTPGTSRALFQVSTVLEHATVALIRHVDVEGDRLSLAPGAWSNGEPRARVEAVLAGLVQGVTSGLGGPVDRVEAAWEGEAVDLTLHR